MKLRRLIDDFQVREISQIPIGASGTFAVYELSKQGWTTLDALSHFSRTLNIPRRNLSHAGLKDRHAVTSQRITIRNGPRRSFQDDNLSLKYLGQSPREISSSDITGNAFQIAMRSLSAEDQSNAERILPELKRCGIPNYFDDQRFGSWYPGHGFVGAAWVREDYEKALWLAFAEYSPDDNSQERQQKEILRDHWKDWITCKQLLDRSHRRSIITFLCDKPADFKGAWGIVNSDLRGLYLSALQSDLWNHLVSRTLTRYCSPDQLAPVELKTGPVHFPQSLSDEQVELLRQIELPLPSARTDLAAEPDAVWLEESLAEKGWTFRELKVKFPRDKFFSRARRAILIPLNDLSGTFSEDELDPGRRKLELTFSLPRGSYATMLVKRLGLEHVDPASPPEESDAP